MPGTEKTVEPASPPIDPAAKMVAAVDVGANSIRMLVAEVFADGRTEVTERFHRAVRLGQDTFRRGRLGAQSMNAAVAILRDYRRSLELYKVQRVRAVATSAVREAANADNFINRVFMATGLNLEVIATSEESRLTVSAVRRAMGDAPELKQGQVLIADVGGGSNLLTVLEDGQIANSLSLRLGSIRLQETLLTSEEPPERSAELLRNHVANVISASQGSLPLAGIRSFVAIGGDARFAARQAGKPTDLAGLHVVTVEDFDRLVRRCASRTSEDLAKRYGMPYNEAETVVPALLVYQVLLHRTEVRQMTVSWVSMRDGLLLELAREVTGEEDRVATESTLQSALAIAEKYHVDMEHAEHVADLAVRVFDELQRDHGLGPRYRLLLRVASLLHEAGVFVSNQAHHKHSYYLIAHSEIFGLKRDEVELVAHVARYHRRSPPKASHLEYMSLPRESRTVVTKMAAMLRVADALVRGRGRNLDNPRFQRRGDELVVFVPNVADLILEQRALAAKGDMFEDVFGLRVRMEEA